MKHLFLLLAFSFCSFFGVSQNETNYANKVTTLDSTIETLYGVISGEKGEARDWELLKFLFLFFFSGL